MSKTSINTKSVFWFLVLLELTALIGIYETCKIKIDQEINKDTKIINDTPIIYQDIEEEPETGFCKS